MGGALCNDRSRYIPEIVCVWKLVQRRQPNKRFGEITLMEKYSCPRRVKIYVILGSGGERVRKEMKI